METHSSLTLLDRFNQWLRESITVKLISIGFLVLILLIPSAWIQNLMEERQQRAESVFTEVSDKWSGEQTVSGPVLIVPYKSHESVYSNLDRNTFETREVQRRLFVLPESLEVSGEMTPEVLHRGIFEAVVYQSKFKAKASFSKPDFRKLDIDPTLVDWHSAHIAVAVSELRGISDAVELAVGKQPLPTESSQNIGVSTRRFAGDFTRHQTDAQQFFSSTGITAPLNWNEENDFNGNTDLILNIKGSRRLMFVPSANTTNVTLKGPWPDPSFDGEFLPSSRTLTGSDFTASWKVLHYNRPYPQHWKEENMKLTGSEFGLKLLVPVDQYQKSIRSSKYSVLIILLTFMALFLVEVTHKVRIHPFQYILIGAALTIYYTLLLSLSEQVGYNWAYWIATIATVVLLSLYSTSFFRNTKLTVLFTLLLIAFYGFIYIIILQQDFSLLIGSIGLFLIVAALMYFSRKVNWYKEVLS